MTAATETSTFATTRTQLSATSPAVTPSARTLPDLTVGNMAGMTEMIICT